MKSICKIKGCKRPRSTRGWCRPHYIRWWRRGGDPSVRLKAAPGDQAPCKVRRCGHAARANGLCHMHAERLRTSGRIGPAEKLVASGSGSCMKGPYKLIRVGRRFVPEHRLVMERKLKRKLRPSEIVHHRNGKGADNRARNLQVTTRAQHMQMHRPEINRALRAAARKRPRK
jgi:hypothetical protein